MNDICFPLVRWARKTTNLTTSFTPTPFDIAGRLKPVNSSRRIDIPVSSTSAEASAACCGSNALARAPAAEGAATTVSAQAYKSLILLWCTRTQVARNPCRRHTSQCADRRFPRCPIRVRLSDLLAVSLGLWKPTAFFTGWKSGFACAPSSALAASTVAASPASNLVACTGGVGCGAKGIGWIHGPMISCIGKNWGSGGGGGCSGRPLYSPRR